MARLPIDTVLVACGPGTPETLAEAWRAQGLRHVAAPGIGSAFGEPGLDLDAALTADGRTTLLLAGTPEAVAATARDAVALGYRVIVEAGSAATLPPGLDLAVADEIAVRAAMARMKHWKNG